MRAPELTAGKAPFTRPRLRRGDERGLALVEFALLLPFFLVMTLGIVDIGRVYAESVQLANSAKEGAAYAQTHPLSQFASGANCADPDNIAYHALTEDGTKRADFSVTVTPNVGCAATSTDQAIAPGSTVTVKVSTPFYPLTPFLSVVTGPLTVSSSVSVVVQG